MDWLSKIFSYVTNKVMSGNLPADISLSASSSKVLPIASGKKSENPHEIKLGKDMTDEQLQIKQERSRYIKVTKNPDYKVKSGDNPAKIAKKFGVEERALLALNGLTNESAKKLRIGQTLKIPDTRTVKNVRNLSDIAKSMGVSLEFIKNLKRVEDGKRLADNQFHNTPYYDDAGVKTIGIGHVVKSGEPENLTNEQVCELCAKDLLKMEENLCVLLGGRKNYDKLPQPMKEALLDMVFNKGTAIIENTPGLLYCLKNGKYEAAINKFTNNKSSKTKKELSGLSKRRLFDISLAVKMYNGKIPQSNINTAQQVYNRGVELLREECRANGHNFKNMLTGYNKDVQSYFGNSLKLKLVTN